MKTLLVDNTLLSELDCSNNYIRQQGIFIYEYSDFTRRKITKYAY